MTLRKISTDCLQECNLPYAFICILKKYTKRFNYSGQRIFTLSPFWFWVYNQMVAGSNPWFTLHHRPVIRLWDKEHKTVLEIFMNVESKVVFHSYWFWLKSYSSKKNRMMNKSSLNFKMWFLQQHETLTRLNVMLGYVIKALSRSG